MRKRFLIKGCRGFTIIELMVAMAVTLFVLTAASQILVALITQFKQQSKIAETSIESLVGLEVLRRDIRSAGFGLPWNIATADFTEAASTPAGTNDDSPDVAPRAILSINGLTGIANIADSTDYLVIKSAAVAQNEAAGKSHTLGGNDNPNTWVPDTSGTNNLQATDSVIVLEWTWANELQLLDNAGTYWTTFSTFDGSPDGFTPDQFETNFIYGIDSGAAPMFPFNRADYYLSTDPSIVPLRCASGTGVLVKSVMLHTDPPTMDSPIPLMDCVADMQVVYRLDTDDDGDADTPEFDLSAAGIDTAVEIRDQVRAVEVYILAHEGQRDPNYTYPSASVEVGPIGLGNSFDLTAITDYEDYRWRVYTLIEKPGELR